MRKKGKKKKNEEKRKVIEGKVTSQGRRFKIMKRKIRKVNGRLLFSL